MLNFVRNLVYTHKFDSWQYIVVTDRNSKRYSVAESIQSDEESILNCVNTNQDETAYYYLGGKYYVVVSTPKDLLAHIPYSPKDNRKHDMNRGFHEFQLYLNGSDTIPIKLVEFAFRIYFEGKKDCEIDLSSTGYALDDDNISKLLYITNALLGLNVFCTVSTSMPKMSPSEDTLPLKDIDTIISSDGICQTYLKIFTYNVNSQKKIDVIDDTQNLKTLKWILNSPQEELDEYHTYINLFFTRCGIPINYKNLWQLIDDYTINNRYSLDMVSKLNVTLNDVMSVMDNTRRIEERLYYKYISIIDGTTPADLKRFLTVEENCECLERIYQKLNGLNYEKNFRLESFKETLIGLDLLPTEVYTLLELIKSMDLSERLSLDITYNVLKRQYKDILSLKDVLDDSSLTLLENVETILQFEYPKPINGKLKERSEKYYQSVFRNLMDVNVISFKKNDRTFSLLTHSGKLTLTVPIRYNKNFLKKSAYALDIEGFGKVNQISDRMFSLSNPNFDFSALSSNEKVLTLTTPELLLKFMDFCYLNHKAETLTETFKEGATIINVGLRQIEYLKYIVYQLFDNSNTLDGLLNDLQLEIPLNVCKKYLKKVRKVLKRTLDIHNFLI